MVWFYQTAAIVLMLAGISAAGIYALDMIAEYVQKKIEKKKGDATNDPTNDSDTSDSILTSSGVHHRKNIKSI
ncbi:hypothetical protein [Listeria booriae]|uniref:hypothetical protein n=1 Tax=Listeria booriae TaxID=1552123 RepID=UPI0016254942|nr:hypothetical protein [Listeria booriae]MBC2100596.1 hypothetical protein [Listeria booriae]MBC2392245.1 hypothetical protein [Listeria booriae]